jgi:uncharacterized protein YcfJ
MKVSALSITMLVCVSIFTACASDSGYPPPSASTPVASNTGKIPTQDDIDSCNAYAKDQAGGGTREVLKDAAIGGVGGAAVGAGGGAIAGGGSGAGKGAAIGAVVGAAAGTLYGLNENRRGSTDYEAAYRSCMSQRGY